MGGGSSLAGSALLPDRDGVSIAVKSARSSHFYPPRLYYPQSLTTNVPARLIAESIFAMPSKPLSQKAMVLISALLILLGLVLAFWAGVNLPSFSAEQSSGTGRAVVAADPAAPRRAVDGATPPPTRMGYLNTARAQALPTQEPTTEPTPRPIGLTVGLGESMPAAFLSDLDAVTLSGGSAVAGSRQIEERPLVYDWLAEGGEPAYNVTFAAATRFDTIFPEIGWQEIQTAWSSSTPTWTVVAVLTTTLPALEQVLGPAGAAVQGRYTITDVVSAAWADDTTLALVPFDQLVPRLVVLAIDGQNPVNNAARFDANVYPLVATIYAHTQSPGRSERAQLAELAAALPAGNRDPNRLTVLTMTGVTAMVRFMAEQMDERGPAWPAEYVGEELAGADITHISNEVPFMAGCETDLRLDNFNFCSKPEYFETLRLTGADIIGLTGNHQNDFGKKAALDSLDFYEIKGLPVYGGGRNLEEANKPLYVEHGGNRMAFLGANSYGPELAWAEADFPGSAVFDLNLLSATIRTIKEKDLADIVLVELQYQESYDTEPLIEQREDFNALNRAGADIVTGVQSHVPQGIEFTDGKIILYGLGNLFFDQMSSTATRENLIYKHTMYNGRHISTQILTTMLYDYGQPRWTSPEERAILLRRIFGASYWE